MRCVLGSGGSLAEMGKRYCTNLSKKTICVCVGGKGGERGHKPSLSSDIILCTNHQLH